MGRMHKFFRPVKKILLLIEKHFFKGTRKYLMEICCKGKVPSAALRNEK